MMDLRDAHERTLARVQKLVVLAGRSTNAHERALAAQKAVEYLAAHPAPLRWRVAAGTPVFVIPSRLMVNPNAIRKDQLKATHARGENWFFEAHRVRGALESRALSHGWLVFDRYETTVFVSAGAVDVFL